MTDRGRRAWLNYCSVVISGVLAIQLIEGLVDTGRWSWSFLACPTSIRALLGHTSRATRWLVQTSPWASRAPKSANSSAAC
jgi:hypothetical protein